jgi:DNA-binding GntR family transcriptional regulator
MNAASAFLEPVLARRLGDQVYARLIEAIATNRLAEGSRIQEDELAARLGVSKTPIREALRRLEAEGFIVADSHRTPEVRRLRRGDVIELYDLREYLERLAIRRIAERADATVMRALEALQTQTEGKFSHGRTIAIEESVAYNQRFHRLVLDGAGNTRLRRMYDLISVDVRRLAYRSIRGAGKQRTALDEHRAILEAVKERGPDLAEALMTQHIRRGRDDVLAQFAAIAGRRPDPSASRSDADLRMKVKQQR